MRNFISNRLGRSVQDQRGFTLIEMVVVIGIIVALAAVIVPLVIQFSGSGAEAAEDAEWDAVQTSIDTMMADNEMFTVLASSAITRVSDTLDWKDPSSTTQTLASYTLAKYTRDADTNYCYTWLDSGRLTAQYKLDTSGATPVCTTTNPTKLNP